MYFHSSHYQQHHYHYSHTNLHFPPQHTPAFTSMCILPWMRQFRPGRLQYPQPPTTAVETCPLFNTTDTNLGYYMQNPGLKWEFQTHILPVRWPVHCLPPMFCICISCIELHSTSTTQLQRVPGALRVNLDKVKSF